MTIHSMTTQPKQMSLRITDLHPIYNQVSHDEAIEIANLSAEVYLTTKKLHYESWTASQSTEEGAKAETWRREGREAVLDSVKGRLASMESLQTELALVRATNETLRTSTEEVATKRAEAMWALKKAEFEIVKLKEIALLKEQIAAATLSGQMVSLLTENNETLKEKVAALEATREELLQQKTKSSHSIGKMGEAMVLDLLTDITRTNFPYSSVKDMTTVVHAADFHVWIMRPSGKRIKMLVDSKKYSKAVNSAEIAKLNKDIDADEEARCGLLLSLDSSICATDQFEIKPTAKCKPVLFLTLQDMDYERRKEMIVWAIQTLMTIVGEEDPAQKNRMLEKIDEFLHDMNTSMKEIDGVIKMQQKATEGLRQVRSDIFDKMKEFSGKEELDTIEHVGAPEVESCACACAVILKATGAPCGKPSIEGSTKCRHHTSSRSKKGSKSVGGKSM